MSKAGKVLHWAARILRVPIVLIWGFLVIAYAFGPERSVPSTLKDAIQYVAMIVSFLALAISWKWELAGGLMALAAVMCWRTLQSARVFVSQPHYSIQCRPFSLELVVSSQREAGVATPSWI